MTRTLAMLAGVPPACAPRLPTDLEAVTTGIVTTVQDAMGAACEKLLGAAAGAGVPVP